MTIEKIKSNIEKNIGNEVKIVFNTGRNKIEEFNAVIKESYNFIFVVKSGKANKSFSYSDVLTKNVTILFK